jgi:hypothetical protein
MMIDYQAQRLYIKLHRCKNQECKKKVSDLIVAYFAIKRASDISKIQKAEEGLSK